MVKNSPCSAGDPGSIPGQGTKIPHTAEQLSQCTTTREPVHRKERSCLMQQRSSVLQLNAVK